MVSVVSRPRADTPPVADTLPRVAQDPIKRAFDIVVAFAMLVFFGPLLLLFALLIRVTSPGPILFRQARGGLSGRVFTIYKFRSMRCQENGAEVVQAMRDDDRITPVGRFMRKTSIDELPQLLNILKGDMSLVGPRPHALAHDVHYGALVAGYAGRFQARPGLTGLAQIKGLRGGTNEIEAMAERVNADVAYIEGWSFWRDIKIMLLTVPHLLTAENAY
jgi:putative colanic acid biosynthesis UDP-glucose lipid carrier transferase